MATTRTTTDTPDFTPSTAAPSGAAAPAVDDVVDMTATIDGSGSAVAQWDGKSTRLTVGRPGLLRDHRLVRTGEAVVFQASRCADETGKLVWMGPEAEHVVDLWTQGFFAGTEAFRQRERRQTVVDEERGIHYEPEWIDPDDHSAGRKGGAKGLAQKTDDEVAAQLRQMLSGGSQEMVRREKQEAREETKPDPRQWAGAQSRPRTN